MTRGKSASSVFGRLEAAAAQLPEEPAAPVAPEASRKPRAPEMPKAPQASEALEVSQAPVEPEAPRVSEEPVAPQAPEEPLASAAPTAPEKPLAPPRRQVAKRWNVRVYEPEQAAAWAMLLQRLHVKLGRAPGLSEVCAAVGRAAEDPAVLAALAAALTEGAVTVPPG